MVTVSLIQGRLPVSQHPAIITPHIKKPGRDAADKANYRPASHVSFVSKLVERVVAIRVHSHLNSNNLLPSCQSAYRKHHSTETARLHIWSDRVTSTNQCQVTLLALLDTSAAFHCVDHAAACRFRITDTSLAWIRMVNSQQLICCSMMYSEGQSTAEWTSVMLFNGITCAYICMQTTPMEQPTYYYVTDDQLWMVQATSEITFI